MLFYVVVVLVVILCVILMVFTHAGFFYSVSIRTSTPLSAPGRVAYKLYRGPYKNAGAAFRELSGLAPHLKTFGIYYDDPKKVTPANQRCIIGCCLTTGSANSAQEGMLQDAGYSMWTFPKCSRAIITEFPLRSMLSIIIAPSCVYPAISKYIKSFELSHTGPVVEVCEEDCIRYIVPLDSIEGFYVPEVTKAEESKKTL